mmetsp:Transcript_35631/g.63662  ORF Transcript_35631/g.63662 Transcript_35631/m.63662 type:complete len:187 (-) Transcript_35631:346-906(-)
MRRFFFAPPPKKTMTDKLTKQQLRDFKETFALFDKDGDGTVTVHELGTVMRTLGQTPTQDELKDMIKEVDHDRSGSIDFEEFVKLMCMRVAGIEADVKYAFDTFDVKKDGKITAEGLHAAFQSLHETISMEDCIKMIQTVDTGGQGYVNYDQFRKMLNIPEEKPMTSPSPKKASPSLKASTTRRRP